jgi:hypothetical protein
VCGAYQLLTSRDALQGVQVTDLVWHKLVPQKVSIFALRLLCNRLPTRSNLMDNDIISDVDAGCLAGCDHLETSQHLFMTCGAVLAWCVRTGPSQYPKPLVSVYSFGRWCACTAFFYAASLVTLCLDYMERS